jgi:hypothetical protein
LWGEKFFCSKNNGPEQLLDYGDEIAVSVGESLAVVAHQHHGKNGLYFGLLPDAIKTNGFAVTEERPIRLTDDYSTTTVFMVTSKVKGEQKLWNGVVAFLRPTTGAVKKWLNATSTNEQDRCAIYQVPLSDKDEDPTPKPVTELINRYGKTMVTATNLTITIKPGGEGYVYRKNDDPEKKCAAGERITVVVGEELFITNERNECINFFPLPNAIKHCGFDVMARMDETDPRLSAKKKYCACVFMITSRVKDEQELREDIVTILLPTEAAAEKWLKSQTNKVETVKSPAK